MKIFSYFKHTLTDNIFSEHTIVFGVSESEHSGRKRVNQIMIFTKRKSNASWCEKGTSSLLTVWCKANKTFLMGYVCAECFGVLEYQFRGIQN